jgi:phosphoribosylanthranilate isomerase
MTTKIKICGLSTRDTLEAALTACADYVGFVFFARSPRNLSLAQARELAGIVEGRAKKVALVVDADDTMLDAIIANLRPDMLQLHGCETPERVAAIRARTGLPVMKAIGVATADDVAHAAAWRYAANMILFDAKPPPDALVPGGNGRPFDWSLLRGVDPGLPWMLSGGLDAGNVGEALKMTRAPAVDVSSGVETAPGVKDAGLIRAFIEAARTLSPAGVEV